jgi:hypothetical protein
MKQFIRVSMNLFDVSQHFDVFYFASTFRSTLCTARHNNVVPEVQVPFVRGNITKNSFLQKRSPTLCSYDVILIVCFERKMQLLLLRQRRENLQVYPLCKGASDSAFTLDQ